MTVDLVAPAPEQYITAVCPTCGSDDRLVVVNPAWLRWRRLRSGLSGAEVGRRAEVAATYISEIERGNRKCPERVLEVYERLPIRALKRVGKGA